MNLQCEAPEPSTRQRPFWIGGLADLLRQPRLYDTSARWSVLSAQPLLADEDMSIDEVIYSAVTRAQPREISSVHSRGSLQSLNDDDTCPSLDIFV